MYKPLKWEVTLFTAVESHILYSYTGTLHGDPYSSSFKLQFTSRLSESAIAPESLMSFNSSLGIRRMDNNIVGHSWYLIRYTCRSSLSPRSVERLKLIRNYNSPTI